MQAAQNLPKAYISLTELCILSGAHCRILSFDRSDWPRGWMNFDGDRSYYLAGTAMTRAVLRGVGDIKGSMSSGLFLFFTDIHCYPTITHSGNLHLHLHTCLPLYTSILQLYSTT